VTERDAAGVLLLVNEAAGSTDEATVAEVVEVLRAAGDVEVVDTAPPGALDAALERRGDRRLVVAGGDGSIHVLVEALRRRQQLDVPVGLVPLGTGNDLARGVGLPHDDPVAAAHRVLDGAPRPLDLLEADDGRVCVNAVHAGVGADAAVRAEDLKASLRELAYPVGALLAGIGADGAAVRVVVDGSVLVDDEVLLVAVCNGTCFGGGATAAPDADPGDGALDVVAVTATGPVARAAFGLALQRGQHLGRDDVHLARGRTVTIVGEGLRDDVDGEVDDAPRAQRTWRVRPGAWRLLV
jgi:YegS/Rv2252/BmrU family lipid kinase